jgi:hypothetical protein
MRFMVTTDTLSPLTKCGAVDGSELACISSCVVVTPNVQEYVLNVTSFTVLTRLAKQELMVAY